MLNSIITLNRNNQLMLEILLDIRDLFSVAPGSTKAGASTIETLERIRRLAGGR